MASYNGITQHNRIYVGQRLKIPPKASSSPKPAASSSQTVLPPELSRIRVSSRWKNIVIHHTATSEGTVEGIDRYHREKQHMENGLAYHFVIGNGKPMRDGEIAVGNRWRRQLDGGHLQSSSHNRTSIGICLVGNFDKQRPTARQMESLEALVRHLMRRCNVKASAVKTHSQMHPRHTACPGKHFPAKTFARQLASSK